MRWSFGAEGRVPRLAQRRVILFFCPTRASSANQISRGLPPAACRIASKRAGKSNGMDRPCSRAEHGRTGLSRSQGAMP